MKRHGIRHVEINAVDDNVLARPADPMFVGLCAAEGFDGAAKVVKPDTVPAVYAAAMPEGAGAEGESAGFMTHPMVQGLGLLLSTLASVSHRFKRMYLTSPCLHTCKS